MTLTADHDDQRVHRLSPIIRLWSLLLGLSALLILNFGAATVRTARALVGGELEFHYWVPTLLGIALVVAGAWWASGLWWKATTYRIDDDHIVWRTGLVVKQERVARFDRVQAVDVVESFVARIFRVASLRVETAGSGDSVLVIEYLPKARAEQLREQVLGRRSGITPVNRQEHTPADAPLATVPLHRSVLSALPSVTNVIAVAYVMSVVLDKAPFAGAVPFLVSALIGMWTTVNQSWRFRVNLSSSGEHLQIEHGLADLQRHTIPLGRIHAVRIRQPVLWRPFGWWRVTVSVAGYANTSLSKGSTNHVLPIGNRDDAIRLATIASDLSEQQWREFLQLGWARHATYSSPKQARWVSPIDHKQQAVTLLDDVAVTHAGRLGRRVSAVHTSRIQELTWRQGPMQRRLKLATLRFDLVSGPIKMNANDLTESNATALFDHLRRRRLPSLEAAPLDTTVEAELPPRFENGDGGAVGEVH